MQLTPASSRAKVPDRLMTDENDVNDNSAYRALKLLSQKSLQSAQQLPAQVDAVSQWSGIGFSLFGLYFLVSMSDFNEMLEVPSLTKLPGVKPWVRGLANVRGRLLPVFDLAAYFGRQLIGVKKQQRLLVLDKDHIYAGLWVDQVLGMQYCPTDSFTKQLPKELPTSLSPFVSGCFDHDDKVWGVFHPLRLLEKQDFLNAAMVN